MHYSNLSKTGRCSSSCISNNENRYSCVKQLSRGKGLKTEGEVEKRNGEEDEFAFVALINVRSYFHDEAILRKGETLLSLLLLSLLLEEIPVPSFNPVSVNDLSGSIAHR